MAVVVKLTDSYAESGQMKHKSNIDFDPEFKNWTDLLVSKLVFIFKMH